MGKNMRIRENGTTPGWTQKKGVEKGHHHQGGHIIKKDELAGGMKGRLFDRVLAHVIAGRGGQAKFLLCPFFEETNFTERQHASKVVTIAVEPIRRKYK